MFDPTAFDNMKVVIEGALYDLDIAGEIIITDRNDIVNLAKMSRSFDICFRLNEEINSPASAVFKMESRLANLAAELLPGATSDLSGCKLKLEFLAEYPFEFNDHQQLESIFRNIWGPSRKIEQKAIYNPVSTQYKTIVMTIDFERFIGEEQIDDLVKMIDFMTETLREIDQL